jgi:hypothetical protein
MRFSYVKYDECAILDQAEFKRSFESLERLTEDRLSNGRAKALVLTKLEEAYMWVGKAIRDEQIERTGKIDEQPERNNE